MKYLCLSFSYTSFSVFRALVFFAMMQALLCGKCFNRLLLLRKFSTPFLWTPRTDRVSGGKHPILNKEKNPFFCIH